jgi:hypothetical protein
METHAQIAISNPTNTGFFNEFLIINLDLNFFQNNVPDYLLRIGINF